MLSLLLLLLPSGMFPLLPIDDIFLYFYSILLVAGILLHQCIAADTSFTISEL